MNTLKGDLVAMAVSSDFEVIVHGQNCIHGWGAGIAKSIARQFPAAKKADLATPKSKKKLGQFSYAICPTSNGKTVIVVNAYTQFDFGKGVKLNYRAMEKAMQAIANKFLDKTIAFPKIGAGHAGGDWDRIRKILLDAYKDVDSTLVVF